MALTPDVALADGTGYFADGVVTGVRLVTVAAVAAVIGVGCRRRPALTERASGSPPCTGAAIGGPPGNSECPTGADPR
ncbi:hypothetical protein GCM10023403_55690 [Pseudonocardia benzenivorans]